MFLNECSFVTTPGVGFGSCGEGFVRFSCFANHADVEECCARMRLLFAGKTNGHA